MRKKYARGICFYNVTNDFPDSFQLNYTVSFQFLAFS